MSLPFNPKLESLPTPLQRLWPELEEVPSEFILYGGTALSLQLGHRKSIDFDFFGNLPFDPDQLADRIPFLQDSRIIQKGENTLSANVIREGTVQVSFFGLPQLNRIYAPLLVPETGLQVASMLDLAGMKVAVVQKRAEAKDFIDLDAIFENSQIDLALSLAAARLIYGPRFSPELTLKALSYFGDGNLSIVPAKAQERILDAVKQVNLDALPEILPPNPNSPDQESRP